MQKLYNFQTALWLSSLIFFLLMAIQLPAQRIVVEAVDERTSILCGEIAAENHPYSFHVEDPSAGYDEFDISIRNVDTGERLGIFYHVGEDVETRHWLEPDDSYVGIYANYVSTGSTDDSTSWFERGINYSFFIDDQLPSFDDIVVLQNTPESGAVTLMATGFSDDISRSPDSYLSGIYEDSFDSPLEVKATEGFPIFRGLIDGQSYPYSMKVSDQCGNESAMTLGVFNFDGTDPSLDILEPVSGARIEKDDLLILKFYATDEAGIEELLVFLDDPGESTLLRTFDRGSDTAEMPGMATMRMPLLSMINTSDDRFSIGGHSLIFIARDVNNRTSRVSVPFRIVR